jgi:hypothetical protein
MTGIIDQKTCDIKTTACQKMMCNKIEALEKVMTTRFDSLDEAMRLRTSELERRLHGLNELRTEVIQDRDTLVRKETYEFGHRALEVKIDQEASKVNHIITRLTIIETRAVTWTASVALFFMILQVVLHFWGPK